MGLQSIESIADLLQWFSMQSLYFLHSLQTRSLFLSLSCVTCSVCHFCMQSVLPKPSIPLLRALSCCHWSTPPGSSTPCSIHFLPHRFACKSHRPVVYSLTLPSHSLHSHSLLDLTCSAAHKAAIFHPNFLHLRFDCIQSPFAHTHFHTSKPSHILLAAYQRRTPDQNHR